MRCVQYWIEADLHDPIVYDPRILPRGEMCRLAQLDQNASTELAVDTKIE
jgi:hypothetical protein